MEIEEEERGVRYLPLLGEAQINQMLDALSSSPVSSFCRRPELSGLGCFWLCRSELPDSLTISLSTYVNVVAGSKDKLATHEMLLIAQEWGGWLAIVGGYIKTAC